MQRARESLRVRRFWRRAFHLVLAVEMRNTRLAVVYEHGRHDSFAGMLASLDSIIFIATYLVLFVKLVCRNGGASEPNSDAL